ncbi:MAG: histidinol-phosphate transaminase [Eubacteriales bacterium]
MSRFFSPDLAGLVPYTPGEQPRDKQYIKLNTNESPFPPSPGVIAALHRGETEKLNLYSSPTAADLTEAIARRYAVPPDHVFAGNGSDEVLAFAFHAFGSAGVSAPDLSYGFYPVFAAFFGLPFYPVPVDECLRIDPDQFVRAKGMVVLANPNAQTGLYLTPAKIETIVRANPDRVVLVDEAYIDFGGESVVPLTKRYDHLLVVQTFSKSRNLAGARIGFAIGHPALIADLNTLKFSFNPYNLNRLSILAGKAAMEDEAYFRRCTEAVIRTREDTTAQLARLGFTCTDSRANFILAQHPRIHGKALYQKLKERGVLVRYLGETETRIDRHVRITVGAREQMDILLAQIAEILQEADL